MLQHCWELLQHDVKQFLEDGFPYCRQELLASFVKGGECLLTVRLTDIAIIMVEMFIPKCPSV